MLDERQGLGESLDDELHDCVGRSQHAVELISSTPAGQLLATLECEVPLSDVGPLPPLWHWLHFLPAYKASETDLDGHGRRGKFLPNLPLPRRMWAGGRLTWNEGNPLRMGDVARRTSRIASVSRKAGRSGPLVFVNVLHEIQNGRGLVLTEEQDIVYRGASATGGAAPQPVSAPIDAVWRREILPDAVLLFRYSALTFNSHRIHYDRDYATGEEGYPGLVVHGPLIATLLIDLLQREMPQAKVCHFEFKAVRPSFDGRPLRLSGQPDAHGRTVRLWAQDHEGRLTMQAEAEIQ